MDDEITNENIHRQSMKELENFQKHLTAINTKDWERLFDLIPQIETTKKFGELKGGEKPENAMIFPYWVSSDIINKTVNVIMELNIDPAFDWSSWEEGKSILNDRKSDYSELDTITLCKLLTTIIRADRFNDGFMISCFESGVMPKIIKGLHKNINSIPSLFK